MSRCGAWRQQSLTTTGSNNVECENGPQRQATISSVNETTDWPIFSTMYVRARAVFWRKNFTKKVFAESICDSCRPFLLMLD